MLRTRHILSQPQEEGFSQCNLLCPHVFICCKYLSIFIWTNKMEKMKLPVTEIRHLGQNLLGAKRETPCGLSGAGLPPFSVLGQPPFPSVVPLLPVPLSGGGTAQAPMFSHSGGSGWEPDQGHSLLRASLGFWPKGEVRAWGVEAGEREGPGFPELWEGEMGVRGPRRGTS